MKHFWRQCITLAMLLSTAGCSNFYRNVEEMYMRPGALDSPVPENFDEYQMKFLDRYRIRHSWPTTSACRYSQLRTKHKSGDISYGDVYIVDDIYEDGQSTKQREAHPTWNFDRFVRSDKSQEPVYETVNGVRSIVRYEEKEYGFKPVCFQYWAGTSHSLTMRLYKSPIEKRIAHYSRKQGRHSKEKIGDQTWWVWHYPFGEGAPNAYGGEAWVLPIGDTDYTLSLELGANQDSLKNPQTHAKMQTMFRHLLESVKIEPLTPAIEAEMAQLKAKAMEIQRQECLDMAKRTKPSKWCQKYLTP